MTPFTRAKEKLEREESYGRVAYKGHVTYHELRDMLAHHSRRQVSLPTCLGIVEATDRDVRRWLADRFVEERAERLTEKTGREPEVSLTLYERPRASGMTHDLLVHGIYAFTDDSREHYFPW